MLVTFDHYPQADANEQNVRASGFSSHNLKNSPLYNTQQTPQFENAEIGQFNFAAQMEPSCIFI